MQKISTTRLRTAIVGCGKVAGTHALAYQSLPNSQLVAVCDVAAERAQDFAKKLNDCRTCHLPARPGDESDEKPHNLFGARLKAVREELRKAGAKSGIAERVDAIANEDSDGDGVSNLLELLAGRFPGEADDRPTAEETTALEIYLAGTHRDRIKDPATWTGVYMGIVSAEQQKAAKDIASQTPPTEDELQKALAIV